MEKELIKLLEDIKKLTILDMVERGGQANIIADILGVDKGTISRLVPARKVKGKNSYGKKIETRNSSKAHQKDRK